MSHVPHDLSEEFPGKADSLRHLRQSDAHVARLVDEYNEVNRTIHRVESNLQPMCDIEALILRKQRIALKDALSAILARADADIMARQG